MVSSLVSARVDPVRSDSPGAGRLRNRGFVVLASVLAGAAVSLVWSFTLVDSVIGDNVANRLLRYNAEATAITGGAMGAMFAFVSGLAGTFTACNFAVFSAIAPLMGTRASLRGRIRSVASPIGWLALGIGSVAGLYGAIAAALGPGVPQLSQAVVGPDHLPVRLIQSIVVFTVVGAAFVYLGLAALDLVPDPLRRVGERHPRARLVVTGGLIGAFLIGRPFPLFFKMFQYAASTRNPFYGALTFLLQAAGNVVILVALFLLLSYGTRGRFQRWLGAKPGRIAAFTAVALLVGGTFMVTYWGIRVPSNFGYLWWPTMPWR